MYEPVRRSLTDIKLLVSLTVVAVGVSFVASLCSCKWHWFGRSGALMTMAGVLLGVRPIIRLGFADWVRSQLTTDGGSFEPSSADLAEMREKVRDSKAVGVGAVMAVVGTLIWAYGDLIGGLP